MGDPEEVLYLCQPFQSHRAIYLQKASSAFLNNGTGSEWFCLNQVGMLTSPTLFHIVLERLMMDALEEHAGIIGMENRMITNL